MVCGSGDTRTRSQPTYEDLKLRGRRAHFSVHGGNGSQPTYEDLKLETEYLSEAVVSVVRSLPTRI